MMSDTSKEAVKRYRPAVHTDGAACMVDCNTGFWVSKPDYDALAAKLAEVTAERDDQAERIDELQHACEVVSSEFEGELWQSCRRLLEKTGFDFHGADVDGIQADDFEAHMNETLDAFDSEVVRASFRAAAMLPRAYRAGVDAGLLKIHTEGIRQGRSFLMGSQSKSAMLLDLAEEIRDQPTPTSAELMTRFKEKDDE